MNLQLAEGALFTARALSARGAPVAIIGQGVKSRFFTTEDPIGRRSRSANEWLTVVGVLEDRKVSDGDGAAARHSRREHGRLRPAADDAAALPQPRAR